MGTSLSVNVLKRWSRMIRDEAIRTFEYVFTQPDAHAQPHAHATHTQFTFPVYLGCLRIRLTKTLIPSFLILISYSFRLHVASNTPLFFPLDSYPQPLP